MRTLSVIGAGKAGSTITRLFHERKLLKIHQLLNSSPASTRRAADFIRSGETIESVRELEPADLWLIGTPDQYIEEIVNQLSESRIINPGNIVFHLSAITSSQVLLPLKECGALIASVHPVFSFAHPQFAVQNYSDVFCGTEGDSEAVELLSALFSAIGSKPFTVNSNNKTLYHAATVFSANYVVTLLNTAKQIAEAAGLDPKTTQELVCSLAAQVVRNVQTLGPKEALTGPLKRGDYGTVEKHRTALKQLDPEFAELYTLFEALTKRDLL